MTGALPAAHEAALGVILAALDGVGHPWALTGSASFALQGMALSPNDIDIQTDEAGAYAIDALLAPYALRHVAFSEAEAIRSHFGRFSVEGVVLEVMGDIQKRWQGRWEPAPDIRPLIRHAPFGGLVVPVLDLHYEAHAYRKLGRHERAESITAFLAGQ